MKFKANQWWNDGAHACTSYWNSGQVAIFRFVIIQYRGKRAGKHIRACSKRSQGSLADSRMGFKYTARQVGQIGAISGMGKQVRPIKKEGRKSLGTKVNKIKSTKQHRDHDCSCSSFFQPHLQSLHQQNAKLSADDAADATFMPRCIFSADVCATAAGFPLVIGCQLANNIAFHYLNSVQWIIVVLYKVHQTRPQNRRMYKPTIHQSELSMGLLGR